MATYIALLYSIVAGPGRRVVMADLRTMADDLGLADPRTMLATGNLVFEADRTTVAELENRLEAAFETAFGKHIDIIVCDAERWRRLVAANPFPEESKSDPSHVTVRVMRDPAEEAVVERLDPYRKGEERMALVDGDLWIYFPHGIGGSRLAGAVARRMGGVGTARNWNTVRRIAAMLEG